ncbi:MAG: PfkB family carbohydrate kinase [bacterium]|nr:PfkB family carbohydrate kinase [bacterium]
MDGPTRPSSKIVGRAELLRLRDQARRDGRSVVQCHGCFDIVHPGHIRHLQHAARQADVLVVTITADACVNKGDGRPLFSEELRAENLAALDCVDLVYVNPDPTAEALLDAVQPDVYIKGREYESNNDPRFAAERDAVERHGGRVVFSSGDIVFSSTALVSAMEHREDPVHARLRQLTQAHGITGERLASLVGAFADQRIVVIGETIIDTYIYCDRPEVASESAVLSLRPLERTAFDGGAAVIARHIAALGGRPVLVTALPPSDQAELFRERMTGCGVEVRSIEVEAPMLEKQRFLVGSQKVMKLDMVRPLALDSGKRAELKALADDAASERGGADGAVLADFGLDLLTPKSLAELSASLRSSVGFVAGDVSGRRSALLSMKKVDLLCPTEVEMRAAVSDYDSSLNSVVWKLMQQTGARQVITTMGDEGLIAFDRIAGAAGEDWSTRVAGEHVPALCAHAIDNLGCGDALLASTTMARIAGAELPEASLIGAVAASIEAGLVGNQAVDATHLLASAKRTVAAALAVKPVAPTRGRMVV